MKCAVIKVVRFDWVNKIFYYEAKEANDETVMHYRNKCLQASGLEDLKHQLLRIYYNYQSFVLLDEQSKVVFNWKDVE